MRVLTFYLLRNYLKENYTIGNLYCTGIELEGKKTRMIEEQFLCNILEDKFRGNDLSKKKVPGETCIPEGTYEIKLTYSPRFKRYLPQLMDVKFFEGVRIHSGNYAGKETFFCTKKRENEFKTLESEEYIEVIDD